MRYAVSGLAATAMILASTATASAQSVTVPYQAIIPAATSSYQATAPAAQVPYQATTQPSTGTYLPQTATPYAAPAPTYAQPSTGTSFATTTPSYASPYTPTQQPTAAAPSPTYVAPAYGTATTTYQTPAAPTYATPTYQTPAYQPSGYASPITAQPLEAPLPASAYTPSVPSTTAPTSVPSSDVAIQDTDTWTYNFARFYPAVQACLRKSTVKNPVIANIQVQGDKTVMLIGDGGSSSFSTCATGLTGTDVKVSSDVRSLPPAFFAPLASTFTISPDRPFQPIVDTDQKVIGWLVRTQPSNAVNQFGQAAGFDGQFIPPMMVNTAVGKS